MTLRLALIDGPLPDGHRALGRQVFLRAAPSADPAGSPADSPADSPAGGHAAALAEAVLSHAPGTRIDSIVVFDGRLSTDAATVARALAAAGGAAVILCAFGLARDDPAIRQAAAELRAGGALVVASAPARGPACYPAALPGVVAVQGDARCAPDAWSVLAPGRFGACPRAGEVRGASAAAGHLAGHLLRQMAGSGGAAGAALAALAAGAAFRGPERRLA